MRQTAPLRVPQGSTVRPAEQPRALEMFESSRVAPEIDLPPSPRHPRPVLLYRLVSLALLALSFALRPTHARCPEGRDLRVGVRRSGEFECWSAVLGDPEYDGTWGRPERGVQRDDAIAGRVWCVGGAVPHQDGHSVWCQR